MYEIIFNCSAILYTLPLTQATKYVMLDELFAFVADRISNIGRFFVENILQEKEKV
jgi:hypothetical protein